MSSTTAEYTYNNTIYSISATMEDHHKLATDQNFLRNYILENSTNTTETVGAVDDSNLVMSTGESNSCTTEDFKWSHETIQLLLKSYRERAHQFRDPKIKKKNLWREIVTIFKHHGYEISNDLLDSKMRNLKKTHRHIKDNNSATGRGRTCWHYYDTFEEIFSNDKTINFGPTLSSRARPLHIPNPSSDIEANTDANADANPDVNADANADANPESNPDANADLNNTSSTSSTEINKSKKTKAGRAKAMYNLQKKLLEGSDDRRESLKVLINKIDQINEIQSDRNKLLEIIIKQRANGSTTH